MVAERISTTSRSGSCPAAAPSSINASHTRYPAARYACTSSSSGNPCWARRRPASSAYSRSRRGESRGAEIVWIPIRIASSASRHCWSYGRNSL